MALCVTFEQSQQPRDPPALVLTLTRQPRPPMMGSVGTSPGIDRNYNDYSCTSRYWNHHCVQCRTLNTADKYSMRSSRLTLLVCCSKLNTVTSCTTTSNIVKGSRGSARELV